MNFGRAGGLIGGVMLGLALAGWPGPLGAHADENQVTEPSPEPTIPADLPVPPAIQPEPVTGPADSAPVADDRPNIPAPPVKPPVVPAPAPGPITGRMLRASFSSPSMHSARTYYIYLPPSYDRGDDRAYPVLYLLHGDDAPANAWPSLGLQSHLERAFGSGLPEMIVVVPDGSGRYGDETDWANRADGTDPLETQVVELVAEVDGTYRTLPDRSFRFIGGYSSGGFGALNIAVRHADEFSVAMSFSGFADARDPQADPGVFGSDEAYLAANSPIDQTASEACRSIYFVLSGGQLDAYFTGRMREFDARLAEAGVGHEFHVVPGAHEPLAWISGLDTGLAHLTASLPQLEGSSDSRQ